MVLPVYLSESGGTTDRLRLPFPPVERNSFYFLNVAAGSNYNFIYTGNLVKKPSSCYRDELWVSPFKQAADLKNKFIL